MENNVLEVPKEQSERTKQATALNRLQNQFRHYDNKYYFKDQRRDQPAVAFQENRGGRKIATSINDERVAKSIVLAAQSKGWDSIKVSGHTDFKRMIWLEASIQGIAVRGYTPQEHDLRELEKAQQKAARPQKELEGREDSRGAATSPSQAQSAPVKSKNSEKADIIKAVAASLLKGSAFPAESQAKILEKIGTQLAARVAAGKVPTVPMYDKNAPTKQPTVDRARPLVERNTQRER